MVSAEKVWGYVLPRVSAALAQFISPIATSGKQDLGSKQGFERFTPGKAAPKRRDPEPNQQQQGSNPQPQQPPRAPATSAQIIPFPGTSKKEVTPTGGLPTGISQALLQLMHMLSSQPTSIIRWLGNSAYQTASRLQKKNGRVKKGTILDESAE